MPQGWDNSATKLAAGLELNSSILSKVFLFVLLGIDNYKHSLKQMQNTHNTISLLIQKYFRREKVVA